LTAQIPTPGPNGQTFAAGDPSLAGPIQPPGGNGQLFATGDPSLNGPIQPPGANGQTFALGDPSLTGPIQSPGVNGQTFATGDPTAGGAALSPSDAKTIASVWAAVNGMDDSQASSFQQVSKAQDGSIVVGPYQLSASAMQQWLSGITNGSGQIDNNTIAQLVQNGEISQQTAQALPAFAQFVNSLQSGQQPSADQIAQAMPQDLQQAIAADLVSAMATQLSQNGSLDPGVLVASMRLGRPATQSDLSDPNIQQLVTTIDSQLSGQSGNTGATQSPLIANNPPADGSGATQSPVIASNPPSGGNQYSVDPSTLPPIG
jgi:hypothetical protein